MDYGVALGRRFRSLKLWFVLRYFGADGIRSRLRHHLEIARLFAEKIRSDKDFELLADVRFSVVVFRCRPAGVTADAPTLDALNARILERVNASGEVFLSHTKVGDRYAIRLAVGNLRTSRATIERAWDLIREAAN
jgi:aromatic-L-amino-acid decarboxylase